MTLNTNESPIGVYTCFTPKNEHFCDCIPSELKVDEIVFLLIQAVGKNNLQKPVVSL